MRSGESEGYNMRWFLTVLLITISAVSGQSQADPNQIPLSIGVGVTHQNTAAEVEREAERIRQLRLQNQIMQQQIEASKRRATEPAATVVTESATKSVPDKIDPEAIKTKGHLNGRLWKGFTDNERIAYMLAYADTVAFLSVLMSSKPEDLEALTHKFWPGLTYRESIDALNRFYDVPENGPIEIMFAMTIVADRAHGVSNDEVETLILSYRGAATK